MAMMGDDGTGPKIDPFMGTSSSNPIGSSDTKGGQTSMDSKRQSTVPPNNNNNYDNNNGMVSTIPSAPFLPPPASNSPAGPPAAPPVYIKDVSMLDTSQYNSDAHLLAACRAKGISPYFATQITRLREYSSVRLVLDDSGSMKAMQQVYGQGPTIRWKILQEMVKEIFDLMTIARGREPLDVYFLNMLPQGMKADTVEALYPFFQRTPQGTTPTLEVMREIMTPEYMVVSSNPPSSSRSRFISQHDRTDPGLSPLPDYSYCSEKKASSPCSSPTEPPTAGTKPSAPSSWTSNVVSPHPT